MKKTKPAFYMPVLHAKYPVYKRKKLSGAMAKCHMPNTEARTRRIEIGSGLTKDQERSALWHEFFHAALHEYGDDEGSDNEALVEALAQAVMRVRREVPWL